MKTNQLNTQTMSLPMIYLYSVAANIVISSFIHLYKNDPLELLPGRLVITSVIVLLVVGLFRLTQTIVSEKV